MCLACRRWASRLCLGLPKPGHQQIWALGVPYLLPLLQSLQQPACDASSHSPRSCDTAEQGPDLELLLFCMLTCA